MDSRTLQILNQQKVRLAGPLNKALKDNTSKRFCITCNKINDLNTYDITLLSIATYIQKGFL